MIVELICSRLSETAVVHRLVHTDSKTIVSYVSVSLVVLGWKHIGWKHSSRYDYLLNA